jgi:hypothetical protein
MTNSTFDPLKRFAAVLLAVAASACGGGAISTPRRPIDVDGPPAQAPEASLIKSDATIMSDAEIHALLSARPALPKELRIAILHLHHKGTDRASYAPVSTIDDGLTATSAGFIEKLRALPQVIDASYLPRFLAPKEPSLAHVRQAAARYQADLAFVFTSTCQLFEQYKVFAANEGKAYCATDAALVDVRTGTIPFVTRARRELLLDESDADMQVQDTARRAELGAIDLALQDNARDLGAFLQRSLRSPTAVVAQ